MHQLNCRKHLRYFIIAFVERKIHRHKWLMTNDLFATLSGPVFIKDTVLLAVYHQESIVIKCLLCIREVRKYKGIS